MVYASFKAIDMDRNYECSRNYKSGWWFPYGVGYDSKNDIINETCQYDRNKPHTNLHGMYDDNKIKNQLQMIFCRKQNVADCILPTSGVGCDGCGIQIDGWMLNHTTTIKLKGARMWLKRS